MIHPFPNTTEAELLEFYLCGIRTGYESKKQAAQHIKYKQSNIVKCDYCPSYHEIPKHFPDDNLVEIAKEEYSSLLTSLYSSKVANLETPTDAIIIRSVN